MTQTSAHSTGVAPGWYPDGRGSIRYFDGTAWTSHVQPAAPQTPSTPPAYASPTPAAAAAAAPAAVPAAATHAAPAEAAPAPAESEKGPLYKEGWFIVDAIVVAAMVLVVIAAAVLG